MNREILVEMHRDGFRYNRIQLYRAWFVDFLVSPRRGNHDQFAERYDSQKGRKPL